MNSLPVALLGEATRVAALKSRLEPWPLTWLDHPDSTSLNLLLDTADDEWRLSLIQQGLPFQVVRDERQVLRAVGAALGKELVETGEALLSGRGRWTCEACSDPVCEHRLFRELIARRQNT